MPVDVLPVPALPWAKALSGERRPATSATTAMIGLDIAVLLVERSLSTDENPTRSLGNASYPKSIHCPLARRMGGAQRYPSRFSMLAYRHERRSSQLHCRGPFVRHRQMSRITRAVARPRSKVMGFASAQPILRAGREQDELRFLARRSYGAAGGQEVRLVVPPTIQPRGSRRCLSA